MRISPNLGRLITHANGTYGMGNGIECENGRQWTVDVFFKRLKAPPKLGALLQLNLSVRRRDAEQHGFPKGTKKGCDDGN